MRTKKTIIAILVLCLVYPPSTQAAPDRPDAPRAASIAKNSATKELPDKTEDAAQDTDAPASPVSPSVTKENEALLPVRPENFNPMVPPASMNIDSASPDGFQQLGTSGLLAAEVRQYTLQLALFTRWLALVAGGGAVLFLIQIVYMRSNALANRKLASALSRHASFTEEGLNAAKESSHKELRAYVHTNGARGEMPGEKGGKYTVRVEVKNFGATPAYALNGWMTVFVGDMIHEKDIQLLPHDSEIVETVLPPGGVCFYYARTLEPIGPEVKAIAGLVRAIYAYGEIRYKDAFGTPHYSRFRIKCSGERNLAGGNFDHCLAGNEAD